MTVEKGNRGSCLEAENINPLLTQLVSYISAHHQRLQGGCPIRPLNVCDVIYRPFWPAILWPFTVSTQWTTGVLRKCGARVWVQNFSTRALRQWSSWTRTDTHASRKKRCLTNGDHQCCLITFGTGFCVTYQCFSLSERSKFGTSFLNILYPWRVFSTWKMSNEIYTNLWSRRSFFAAKCFVFISHLLLFVSHHVNQWGFVAIF